MTAPTFTLRQRLRYAFDNTMARGTSALVVWLALVTLFLVVVFTLLVIVTRIAPPADGHRDNFFRQLVKTLFHAMDPGTIGGDTFKWPYIVVMLAVTLGGIFIVSALIGVIATAFDEKLNELRKGRSFVIEKDHTLVLGWSESVFTILSELAIANESERKPSVVILAEKDKVEMEDAIEAKVGDTGRTQVICRNGSPIDLNDLEIVNPRAARSIIVLSAAEAEADAEVIKTLLAVTQNPNRRVEPYHIVAEIEDAKNLEAARIVGGDETVLIDKGQTIARLLVQASRQSGVSTVYTELFDFGGDEIYFRLDPALEGKSYADALLAYEDCAVIGLRSNGKVKVNPPSSVRLEAGHEVVAVAADDATLLAAKPLAAAIDETAIAAASDLPRAPSRVLLLGWNSRSSTVVRELNEYLDPGSALTVVAEVASAGDTIARTSPALANLRIDFREGSTTDRAVLDSLDVLSYDTIIVMCYADLYDAQRADARTLVTLLHLRDISAKTGADISIVSEMLDDRNRELAQVTKVDDVIVSDKVISLIITQISENPALAAVFDDLLDAAGSEIYLRPVERYVSRETTFATVVAAAARLGETAIGYRRAAAADDAGQTFGVVVNPPKSLAVAAAAGDRVIVLAED